MADPQQPPIPPQPSTVKLEAPPAWAIEMSQRVQDGFAKIQAAIDGLIESDRNHGERLMRSEKRQDDFEEWRARASERAKQPSAVDLEQSAAIASAKVAHEALAKTVDDQAKKLDDIATKTDAQTVILERLDRLTANPAVKLFGHALLVAFLYWLATKGIQVKMP